MWRVHSILSPTSPTLQHRLARKLFDIVDQPASPCPKNFGVLCVQRTPGKDGPRKLQLDVARQGVAEFGDALDLRTIVRVARVAAFDRPCRQRQRVAAEL